MEKYTAYIKVELTKSDSREAEMTACRIADMVGGVIEKIENDNDLPF